MAETVVADTPRNEIKAPLTSPTQIVTPEASEEPFLKAKEEPVVEKTVTPVTPPVQETQSSGINFDWDLSSEPVQPVTAPEPVAEEPQQEEVKRFFLDDETETKNSLENNTGTRSTLTPEEIQRRNTERMERIQQYNIKLKKAEGLKELEDEPAFVRRNIRLDEVSKSSEQKVSRFGLTDDQSGSGLRTNNSFLHDNVD